MCARVDFRLARSCSVLGVPDRRARGSYATAHSIVCSNDASESGDELIHLGVVAGQVGELTPMHAVSVVISLMSSTWNRSTSFYQILYGCLGIGQAIFSSFL